ncbi:peptidyl-arginine deiminase [Streptomyces agglomeratus]|uniref:Peptidyl-arginine deiminase n=1 Tax=Streptomyces agglomeratus TaxID=285458 RepID=A0A1E5P2C5_9ACTN|nr:peptidyl-arginine deiminase [Streptomyces agglomeratus]OEJ43283.1 peptidyl-arginine deiminase [Streptomyces agglomeratus]OEJ54797.1 peptidyl-arginine deiminase [Streptomyces agglomeratus]
MEKVVKERSRRALLRSGAAAALGGAGFLAAACAPAPNGGPGAGPTAPASPGGASPDRRRLALPAESMRHERTFMAWPPSDSVWEDATAAVQRDVARLARAVAEYEPVTLLAAPAEAGRARRACGAQVEIMPVPVDDLWMRDSGPTFVTGPGGAVAGTDFHFNGWGGKQGHRRDGQVAKRLLTREDVARIDASITAEGGSLDTDGAGTLLVTESSLVNPNRNPGRSRADIEGALKDLLGVDKVIWLKGVRGEDITDCHVDALARFAEPGVVVLSRPPAGAGPDVWTRVYDQARGVLESATDARGKRLEIVELPEPEPAELGERGADFLGSYVNYYVINGAVLLPRFGDRTADDRAASVVRDLHPGRTVVQLDISTLAEGGGGIHCATQQRPAV